MAVLTDSKAGQKTSAAQAISRTSGSASGKRHRPWWHYAVAFAGCQILALLAVEGILACAGLGEEEIFRFDQQLGFCHIPNKKVTWRTEGFAVSYFNSDGLRESNVTVEKPANTYRVALLGDSMTEGLQVPLDKTYGQLIAKRLSPLNGKRVDVINFATSGYSTVQEFLQLKRQVLRYNPDLVIVNYDSRDIFENWAAPDAVITNIRPVAIRLPNGPLYVDSSPVLRWWGTPRAKFLLGTSWLREHSRIYGLMTALELDWSQHSAFYRAFIDGINHPKKARKDLAEAMKPANLSKWIGDSVSGAVKGWLAAPSFQVQFYSGSNHGSVPIAGPAPSSAVAGARPAGGAQTSKAGQETASGAKADPPMYNCMTSNDSLSKQPALPGKQASLVSAGSARSSSADPPMYNCMTSNDSLSKQPALPGKQASSVSAGNASSSTADPPMYNCMTSNDSLSKQPTSPLTTMDSKSSANKTASEDTLFVSDPKDPLFSYKALVARTMDALLFEMKRDCANRGAKVAVIGLPARSQLCPDSGLEDSFRGIDYNHELEIVRKICAKENIGFFDCEASAEELPKKVRNVLFYTVHLTPAGQEFVADSTESFVKDQLIAPLK